MARRLVLLLLLSSIAVIACAAQDAMQPAAAEIQKRKQSDYDTPKEHYKPDPDDKPKHDYKPDKYDDKPKHDYDKPKHDYDAPKPDYHKGHKPGDYKPYEEAPEHEYKPNPKPYGPGPDHEYKPHEPKHNGYKDEHTKYRKPHHKEDDYERLEQPEGPYGHDDDHNNDHDYYGIRPDNVPGGYYGGKGGRQRINLDTIWGNTAGNKATAKAGADFGLACVNPLTPLPNAPVILDGVYDVEIIGVGQGEIVTPQEPPPPSITALPVSTSPVIIDGQSAVEIATLQGSLTFGPDAGRCHPELLNATATFDDVRVFALVARTAIPTDVTLLNLNFLDGLFGGGDGRAVNPVSTPAAKTGKNTPVKVAQVDATSGATSASGNVFCGITLLARGAVTLTTPAPVNPIGSQGTIPKPTVYEGILNSPLAWYNTDIYVLLPASLNSVLTIEPPGQVNKGQSQSQLAAKLLQFVKSNASSKDLLSGHLSLLETMCRNGNIPNVVPGEINLLVQGVREPRV